jgi:CBS domain-containing protein
MNNDRVKDVMTTLVVMVYPNDSIQQVASRLVRNHISGAPVVRDGKVVGIISEVDISHALLGRANIDKGLAAADVLSLILRSGHTEHKHVRVAADVMSTPVVTIGPKQSLIKAAQLLDRHGIKRLPVVDDEGYLLGILSRGDLVRAMTRTDADILQEVEEALAVLGADVFEDLSIDIDDGVVALSGTADRLSTRTIAVEMVSKVTGVVEVADRLDFLTDDTSMKHLANLSADRQGRDPWAVGPLVKEA